MELNKNRVGIQSKAIDMNWNWLSLIELIDPQVMQAWYFARRDIIHTQIFHTVKCTKYPLVYAQV